MRSLPRYAAALVAVVALISMSIGSASAATVLVTQNNPGGWSTADTRPGGAVSFSGSYGAPGGLGASALELTTDATTSAKAQFIHGEWTPLAGVYELSYWTYQAAASFAGGDASYQLQICAGGVDGNDCVGFTTLVFEPYQNGAVAPGWQFWDVDQGQFWSSQSYTDGGTCVLAAGGGGAPFYTVAGVSAACPNAIVVGFGVNVGTYNPSYTVATDGVTFNGTTHDFEVGTRPTSKSDCKKGGWQTFNDPAFTNQGDCVSWAAQNT